MPRVVTVSWEYEDRLPDDETPGGGLTDDQFGRMFRLSRVIDGARMYPYLVDQYGERAYLGSAPGRHHAEDR